MSSSDRERVEGFQRTRSSAVVVAVAVASAVAVSSALALTLRRHDQTRGPRIRQPLYWGTRI